jgi:hypothetical protein
MKKRHKQIVVLLGAGAAIEWGAPCSETIKRKFIEGKHLPLIKGKTVGQFIFDILRSFYRSDCANFETFLAVLEEVLSYVIAATNSGGVNAGNTLFTPAIFKLKCEIEDLLVGKTDIEKRQCCYYLYRHYINLLISTINDYNQTVLNSSYNIINETLFKFTKYFLVQGYSVKFYTTNYDSIVPQILSHYLKKYKLYEGFRNNEHGKFNYNLTMFRKARLSHFNIHGSIFLHQVINGIQRETEYSVLRQSLPKIAISTGSGNPGEPLLFSPIITGYNKTQRISDKPFNLGFNAFTNDCNDCKALVTIGYSYSDPHINSILSTFVNWDRVKFMHITKCAGDFDKCSSHEYFNLNAVTAIYKGMEDDTWLHGMCDQKHVYKRGFKEFLQDSSNWKLILPR